MATQFYKWQDGQKKYLSSKEVKAFIMKQNKWTEKQYYNQYHLFKNRLRAYESFKSAQGVKVVKQSPVELLYKEAKSKQTYGRDYKPSQKMKQIRKFSAVSITKGRQYATQQKYVEKQSKKYKTFINKRFGDFIKANKGASDIVDQFKQDAKEKGTMVNYVKLEKALSDYADKVHARVDEEEKVQNNEAIFSGEVFGSDNTIDFDIDAYL